MYTLIFVVIVFLSLLRPASSQVKACYAWDGSSSGNFPCDPEADVSACCGPGSICVTSLYCTSQFNTSLVGCCTDRTWKSKACPYRLGLNEETDPLTQHFSYANNVTICDDGTLCPNPKNETCCKKHQGRSELNYHNRARLPESVTGLASYYAQAGYTIPGASATPSVELHAAQSSPVPTAAAHSSSPTSSTGFGNTSSTPASPAAKQSLNPLPSSSGLSAGAKAGMGVGIGVAAMICATVAFIFYLRRRKHQKSETLHASNDDAYSPEYKDQYQPPAPMYYSPELAADTAKYEVDASPESQPNSPHEVPGSIPVKRP